MKLYDYSCINLLLILTQWNKLTTRQIAWLLGWPPHVVNKYGSNEWCLSKSDHKIYSCYEEQFLINNYRHMSNIELARELNTWWPFNNVTPERINCKLRIMGLFRSELEVREIKLNNIINGSYKNCGGHSKKIGDISIRKGAVKIKGGNRADGKFIKTESGWKLHKYHVWEQAYGPVPPDSQLQCIDGNELNTELSNLRLVKRLEAAWKFCAGRELTDAYVAFTIDRKHSKEEREDLVKYCKDLLNAKRIIIESNRKIDDTARQMARRIAENGREGI